MKIQDPEKPLILVVDDLPANLHVLVSALRADYRLKTTTNGQEALKLAALADRPDLILLDVMMPGMSGIDVMRHLRVRLETRDIPVIFVSADISEQSQLEGLRLGADDYLIKPVLPSVLQVRVHNLLHRKRTERQLHLASHVFEYSGEAIMITDRDNNIIEVNPTFTKLTGYSPEEVRGNNPRMLSSGRTTREEYAAMWKRIMEEGFWQGELWDRTKRGSVYPKFLTISVVRSAQNEIDFFIGSFTDISERKAAEERIMHLAHHDVLTGLFNRFSLQNRLAQALATVRREQGMLSVVFIDMDRFKFINDTLGHAAGDLLLVEVGRRLNSSVRESDIVARLGGDEFVVVLTEVEDANAAARVANKILASLGQPYILGDHEVHSTPSIGISMYPGDGDTSESLMKNADMALYHAKAQGRNNAQFFTAAMNQETMERLQMEQDLRQAVAAGQFEVHYQPQLNGRDGRIVGFEALVRWRHPRHGMVSPAKFIPIAEETGLIMPLGAWVFDEACRQLRAWRQQGLLDVTMAVNLSARQLRSPALLSDVAEALEKHGLTGPDLELEITESVAMTHPEASIGQLKALRILGVRLSIDDFGTGYSSLSYLKLLPIHALKLDQSFVSDIEVDKNDVAICSATISLAHNLGLSVVAEGVETMTQRDFLVAHQCDVLQGYLFSKPLPAAEAFAYAEKHGKQRSERG